MSGPVVTPSVARPPRLTASVGVRAVVAVAGGVAVTTTLPPRLWWWAGPVGVAALDGAVSGLARGRSRALVAWLWALGWLGPGLAWMRSFTLPGWLIATAVYAGYFAVAAALAPPRAGRRTALGAGVVAAELLRWSWPFGGVPVSSLAVGQAGGPLLELARLGGAALVAGAVVTVGMALSAAVAAVAARRPPVGPAVVLAGVAAVVGVGAVAPRGAATGATPRVALVQGGGEQGTRAIHTDPEVVLRRHLDATATIDEPVDLVIWPEDVVDVDGPFTASPARDRLAAAAARVGAPLLVGVTETVGDRFVNFVVVVSADGTLGDTYTKVHRVPFGEWVPLRRVLERVTDLSAVPRDAVPGQGEALVDTPVGPLAVPISWEVFFTARVTEAVAAGGAAVVNPTNGASYDDPMVQRQQVLMSRIRAVETGRWVAQVAPTGFTAVIDPDGRVVHRTGIGERAVVVTDLPLRTGRTPLVAVGHRWPAWTTVAVWAAGWWWVSRPRLVRPDTRRRATGASPAGGR